MSRRGGIAEYTPPTRSSRWLTCARAQVQDASRPRQRESAVHPHGSGQAAQALCLADDNAWTHLTILSGSLSVSRRHGRMASSQGVGGGAGSAGQGARGARGGALARKGGAELGAKYSRVVVGHACSSRKRRRAARRCLSDLESAQIHKHSLVRAPLRSSGMDSAGDVDARAHRQRGQDHARRRRTRGAYCVEQGNHASRWPTRSSTTRMQICRVKAELISAFVAGGVIKLARITASARAAPGRVQRATQSRLRFTGDGIRNLHQRSFFSIDAGKSRNRLLELLLLVGSPPIHGRRRRLVGLLDAFCMLFRIDERLLELLDALLPSSGGHSNQVAC